MAYPAWVAPQPMDVFGGFQGGFNVGQRLGSEQTGREGFAKYSDWLGQQQGQFARQQPGFLANVANPSAYAPSGPDVVAGSHAAAQGANVPELQGGLESYIANARAAESGGNPNAKNPLSSATGLYQFTSGTWNDLMRQHPNLGLTPDGRTDPAQQERAMRQFTLGNAQNLASANLPVTPGTLYASHFLGAGGARQVLSQPDTAPMASVVSAEVINANPFLRDMTVGDFKQWSDSKGGGANGGYAPPRDASEAAAALATGGQPEQQAQASPAMAFAAPGSPAAPVGALPPAEVMNALFRSPETRQLAISLAQTAQQGLQPPEFTQFQREDGSVWQMNTQTGHMQVLQGTGGGSSFSQTPVFLTDPEGNQHIAQMSNTGGILVNGQQLAGVPEGWSIVARPDNMRSIDTGAGFGTFDPNSGTYGEIQLPRQGAPGQNLDVALNEDGSRIMVPAAGSPEALERQDAEVRAIASAEQTGATARLVREDIDRIRDIVRNAPWYNPAVGLGSGLLAGIEGSPARDVAELSQTVLANVGFDRLQQMRDASPTGGALGAISDRELGTLQAVMGNLSQSQSMDQFLYNLDRLGEIYDGIIQKASAYPNASQYGFGGEGAAASGQQETAINAPTAAPQRELVRTETVPTRYYDNPSRYQSETPPDDWEGNRDSWPYMTPEARALWP